MDNSIVVEDDSGPQLTTDNNESNVATINLPAAENAAENAATKTIPVVRLSKNYTRVEDEQILSYIAHNKRYDEVGGIKLWNIMEERQVVPNR